MKNRKGRMVFAKEHLSWIHKDWQKVLFSDESELCLLKINWYIRHLMLIHIRNSPRHQTLTVDDDNVRVQGCFGLSERGALHCIHGNIYAFMCKNIIENIMFPFVHKKYLRNGFTSKTVTLSMMNSKELFRTKIKNADEKFDDLSQT